MQIKDLIESEALKVSPTKRQLAIRSKSKITLERLSKDWNFYIRCKVARNPNCPVEVLEKLSNEQSDIRYEVAQNPNCTLNILKKMYKGSDWYICSKIAEHKNCSPDFLHTLSKYPSHHVKYFVAKNPNCSIETLLELSHSFYTEVRKAAIDARWSLAIKSKRIYNGMLE